MTDTTELCVGLTDHARQWCAFVAKNIKTLPATNGEQWFLFGRTYLDKPTFNKINDEEHDVVHGVGIFYGPFNTKAAAMEHVTEYPTGPNDWPGNNDWVLISPGKPIILTPYSDPADAIVVHNKSLEFQGQAILNKQQEQLEEIESIKKRMEKRLEEHPNATPEELQAHIDIQMERIRQAKDVVNGLESHLRYLQRELSEKTT